MSDWLRKNIGELCDIGGGKVKTGPFGSQLHQSDYSEEGTPVVMPTDIHGGGISELKIARVSDNHVDRLIKHKLSKGDIIYGRRGDIGRQALITDSNAGWLCGTGCLRVTLGKTEVLPDFLHLYLKMPEVIGWIQNQAVGATMPNLNTQILRRVPIFYPSCKIVQQKIIGLISAYDDLIENNKRRIALLEQMAEEIYREWFVRFRFPGYQTAEFEKGIPKGWTFKALDTVCKEVRDTIKKKDLKDDEIYLGLEHLSRKSISIKKSDTAASINSNKLRFRKRDILFGKIRPYLHKVVISHISGACSSDTIVIRPIENKYEAYVLFTIFSNTFIDLATTSSKGTKMPRADWDYLKEQEFPIPSETILTQYQKVFDVQYMQICNLLNANKNLEKTKNMLLPRLISGKLSVEDLDIQFSPSMQEVFKHD